MTNDDGVRKTFYSSIPGRKGQTECNRKADGWLASTLRNPNERCGSLIDSWLADLEKHSNVQTVDGRPQKTSHFVTTKSIAKNWIAPVLKDVKIGKLRRSHLQDVINSAYDAKLSKKTLKDIRGAMSLWLTYCRKRDLTTLTSADIEIPKDARSGQRTILQPEELRKLFSSSNSTWRGKVVPSWYIHAWRFAVVVGLRPGELIAIERKHIDDGRLYIRGSINQRSVKTTGKNENAVRDIALHPLAESIIADQIAMMQKAGIISKYLFPAPDGSAAKQDVMSNDWKRYKEHNGIGNVTPYELRHTFVSVTAGLSRLNIGELRAVIGHSQNMDTLGTYAHKLSDAEKQIASKINTAYDEILKPKSTEK